MISSQKIRIEGGCGGDGLASFRREKYIPFGGPDGGDGGDGGSVYVMSSLEVDDLGLLRRRKKFVAGNGNQGGSWRKHGKKGEDLTILVPVGTMVFVTTEAGNEVLIADLTTAEQKVLVAKGGRGGLGNVHFATAVNQAPEVASKGEPGEERHIILEVKFLTDMCIIGYPNSGKSTFLSAVCGARPKIADYPFTTRQPILGVIQGEKRDFIVAEVPGLVAGSHAGKGLGNGFLRHVERTKILIYLLDGTSPAIVADLSKLNEELALYKTDLPLKPKIVAVNKVDLPQVQARLPDIKQALNKLEVPIFYISAVSGQGVMELGDKAMEMVEQGPELIAGSCQPSALSFAVFHPRPKKV
jgi:Obg family GTPase CgtA